MSHSQTFKIVRLSVILLFIMALVSIVIHSGKQLVITKKVEVPTTVEKVVEVPVYVREDNETNSEDIHEENRSNGEVKTEAKHTVKRTVALISGILCAICFLGGNVFFALEDAGKTTDKENWVTAFALLTVAFGVIAFFLPIIR